MSQVSLSLLKRPIFLSILPAEEFRRIEKRHLFAEIARLDKLLEQYPELIAAQTDSAIVASLQYCQNAALTRYIELRGLL